MIERLATDYILENGFISETEAIDDDLIGLKIFDSPIVGYASVDDELFSKYKTDHDIMYNKFMMPKEWLNCGTTVISMFFPFTDSVKNSNIINKKMPSNEWLHARYEGQKIINECCKYLVDTLKEKGFDAVAPSIDERFSATIGTHLENQENLTNMDYYSNWSERHVAFVAGLGTFGLSKGLITKKGMAGRFASIITNYKHEITERKYTDTYEYCTMCGECISRCPVKAIAFENDKNHTKCSKLIDFTLEKFNPRYACGKCQVDVPCSSQIPK